MSRVDSDRDAVFMTVSAGSGNGGGVSDEVF